LTRVGFFDDAGEKATAGEDFNGGMEADVDVECGERGNCAADMDKGMELAFNRLGNK